MFSLNLFGRREFRGVPYGPQWAVHIQLVAVPENSVLSKFFSILTTSRGNEQTPVMERDLEANSCSTGCFFFFFLGLGADRVGDMVVWWCARGRPSICFHSEYFKRLLAGGIVAIWFLDP